ncbi:flavodoxin domain-containing protein [Actinokineospora xionganensis]|uniref:Flavodoxin n=1 Tax=Actinokineospora xionganensis TaxID=2684470 RepID=A0ABR7KZL1_9PSEU|nr:flavodoxin domain-containing protein [Actinokineospora xionganensis]MBC6445870.1 flavodoxin [Actinokineospora xionganensis]
MERKPQVLVAYATGTGSTKGVAERIAATLTEQGHPAHARCVTEQPDPADYDVVILGSAVNGAAWLPDAVGYTRTHQGSLAQRPLWLFSVGLRGTQRGPITKVFARQQARAELPGVTGSLRPRGYRFFAGVMDEASTSRLSRLVWKGLGGRFGDFRDWAAIDAWARDIAESLAAARR